MKHVMIAFAMLFAAAGVAEMPAKYAEYEATARREFPFPGLKVGDSASFTTANGNRVSGKITRIDERGVMIESRGWATLYTPARLGEKGCAMFYPAAYETWIKAEAERISRRLVTAEGRVYHGVTVRRVTHEGLVVSHDGGTMTVAFERLPDRLQDQYREAFEKAVKEEEQKQRKLRQIDGFSGFTFGEKPHRKYLVGRKASYFLVRPKSGELKRFEELRVHTTRGYIFKIEYQYNLERPSEDVIALCTGYLELKKRYPAARVTDEEVLWKEMALPSGGAYGYEHNGRKLSFRIALFSLAVKEGKVVGSGSLTMAMEDCALGKLLAELERNDDDALLQRKTLDAFFKKHPDKKEQLPYTEIDEEITELAVNAPAREADRALGDAEFDAEPIKETRERMRRITWYKTRRDCVARAGQVNCRIEPYLSRTDNGGVQLHFLTRYAAEKTKEHRPKWIFFEKIRLRGDNGAEVVIETRPPEKRTENTREALTEWSDNNLTAATAAALLELAEADAIQVTLLGKLPYEFEMTKYKQKALREILQKY